MKSIGFASATAAAALLSMSGIASAQTVASATTDLNIRSGPGPQHDVVGVIGGSEEVTVRGCLEDAKWCRVTHDGVEGWSYADYLTASFEGRDEVVVMTEAPRERVPAATYEAPQASTTVDTDGGEGGATAGAATGAVAGALIGGPVGAAVGGAAGAVAGGVMDEATDPPEEAVRYVRENRVDPVYLEGEVVRGAGLPENVQVRDIPGYEYDYAYINRQPVLVEPGSRRIVHVIR